MDKKYRLTEETIPYWGRTLHRIEALYNFNDIKIGQRGGYVESEDNLSQLGDCWIYDNAKVFDNASVYGNARIYNNAHVYSNVKVHGSAIIKNNVYICDNAEVYDFAKISEEVLIFGNTKIWGNAIVSDYACIKDSAIYDYAHISGNVHIVDKSCIYGGVSIQDNVVIRNSHIFGYIEICGHAVIRNAKVSKTDDYIVFKNWWSSGRYFTWTKSNNMWSVGCFYGTGKELIEKAYNDSELSGREYERIVKYVEYITNGNEI